MSNQSNTRKHLVMLENNQQAENSRHEFAGAHISTFSAKVIAGSIPALVTLLIRFVGRIKHNERNITLSILWIEARFPRS